MSPGRAAPRARILMAKPGLDGHDRGALVVSRALRDAGYEVVYTGRRQTPAQIAAIAIQENVDVVGLSILSGSHVELVTEVMRELSARGADDIPVAVGGTVLRAEEPILHDLGVKAIFPTGIPLAECVRGIDDLLREDR